MNTIIPEGKVQITASANLKDRIANVQFTAQGYELWITKIVDEKDEDKQRELLNSVVEDLVQKYFAKLGKELKASRNELVDNLRIDLEKEYDVKIKKAKEMIMELRKENKELKKIVNDLMDK